MKLSRSSPSEAVTLLALLAAATPTHAIMLTCNKLVVDGHKFDLSPLKGPHSVVTSEFLPPSYSNTTYTLDICAFLKRNDDVAPDAQCKNGARVCGIRRFWKPDGKVDEIQYAIPIAGAFLDKGGKDFEWEAKRLKTSESKDDVGKEGVRVTLKGGTFRERAQRAVIEFRCDPNVEGTENEWESEDKYIPGTPDIAARMLQSMGELGGREDGNPSEGFPERQLKKDNATLIWEGRQLAEDVDTLYLTWNTKYACESQGEADIPPNKHWGFFTWLVILAFLGVASYLIFGSWLNYNRYGARGWDLLPHGDTLRDVPYLLKDWIRRVLNTVQGSGSRGGYSAV